MILKRIKNFCLGYLVIEIEGFFIERFFNMCAKEKIRLWGTKRKNKIAVTTKMSIDDFRQIRKIAKETNSRVKIKKKRGIIFEIKKYKNRKVFIFLFFMLVLSIFALSNFIWNIEITGNEQISEKELIEVLNKNGLKQGSLKMKIDSKKIIEKIRLENEKISWIGIDIKGTNAKITISEATEKPEIVDENEYCDIVSTKEGIITKVNAINRNSVSKRR
ncbi:MAG: sporulation protein YqfD [Clostridia bacterium]|jgi:similar to stage IV sporulation protein|nr:sporulation protein YqfD [Clostridia bacterium]